MKELIKFIEKLTNLRIGLMTLLGAFILCLLLVKGAYASCTECGEGGDGGLGRVGCHKALCGDEKGGVNFSPDNDKPDTEPPGGGGGGCSFRGIAVRYYLDKNNNGQFDKTGPDCFIQNPANQCSAVSASYPVGPCAENLSDVTTGIKIIEDRWDGPVTTTYDRNLSHNNICAGVTSGFTQAFTFAKKVDNTDYNISYFRNSGLWVYVTPNLPDGYYVSNRIDPCGNDGTCEYTSGSPTLPCGWNQFDILVSPGDISCSISVAGQSSVSAGDTLYPFTASKGGAYTPNSLLETRIVTPVDSCAISTGHDAYVMYVDNYHRLGESYTLGNRTWNYTNGREWWGSYTANYTFNPERFKSVNGGPCSDVNCYFDTRAIWRDNSDHQIESITVGTKKYTKDLTANSAWQVETVYDNPFYNQPHAPCHSAENPGQACVFKTRTLYYSQDDVLQESVTVGSKRYDYKEGSGWRDFDHNLSSITRYTTKLDASDVPPCLNNASCSFDARDMYKRPSGDIVEVIIIGNDKYISVYSAGVWQAWWKIDMANHPDYTDKYLAPCTEDASSKFVLNPNINSDTPWGSSTYTINLDGNSIGNDDVGDYSLYVKGKNTWDYWCGGSSDFNVANLSNTAWWQVKESDVTTGGNLGSILPLGEYFMDDSVFADKPGVPVYGLNLSIATNSISDVYNWYANTGTDISQQPDYDYLYGKIPSDIEPTPLTEITGNGFADSATADAKGYKWFKANDEDGTVDISGISGFSDKAIVFVDGNVNISSNITLSGGFLMIITNGSVTIESGVENVQGILVVDGNLNTDSDAGTVDDPELAVFGSTIVWGNVNLYRDLGAALNSTPAETFEFSPALFMLIPEEFNSGIMRWQKVEPELP